jgi:septal ring factor EnvC (AmiA/AmiB activator)
MSTLEIVAVAAMVVVTMGILYALRRQDAVLTASDVAALQNRVSELERTNAVLQQLVADQSKRLAELEKMLRTRSDEVFILRSRLRQSGLDWSVMRDEEPGVD